MPVTKTQLTGGVFQDSEGNALALGYLMFKLNQDNSISGVASLAAGIEVKITLNSSGSVDTSTPQYIWATDVMTVPNAFYTVTGYTAQGQRAWGPNNQQVTSGGLGGGTFDCGTWVPNSVFSWTPPVQPLLLQTNGTNNGSQIKLNLAAGTNISATDNGSGTITLAVTGITGIALKTNGTPNSSQTVLNLEAGGNITLTDLGSGAIQIAATIPPTPPVPPTLIGMSTSSGGSTSLNSSGWLVNSFSPTGLNLSINNGNNTTPAYNTCTVSSGLAGGNGNFHTSTSDLFPLGQVQTFRAKVRLNQTTNVRMWIGILTEVTSVTSDLPNANIAAFRYSTLAGDTKWQCITATDNTHDTITPQSGNNLDTNFHIFEIQYSPTGPTVTFLIDGAVVATSTTNLPTLGNLMFYIAIDNANVAYQPTFDYAWTVCQANF
jgi:hypothetical protein